jgi:prohibitin 2
MDYFKEHTKGCLVSVGIAAVIVIAIILIATSYKRIDPGNAGIVVNYAASSNGKPAIQSLGTGQYVFIGPFSGMQLVEYPIAQQQLVLASRSDEGELTGDSTIPCLMSGGGTLNIGLTVNWQVNSQHPEVLYLMKPNVPLTSSLNNDINTTLVYGAVRGDLLDICTHYRWQQVLGDGSTPTTGDQIKSDLLAALQRDLSADGIIVNSVYLNERRPDATIQAVLNANNDAQKSAYLKQQAEYQAAAQVAQAQGQAQSIAIINAQLEKSPAYVQYLLAQKWDGKLPSTEVTDGKANPIVGSFGSGG